MLKRVQRFLQSIQAGPQLDLAYLMNRAAPQASLEERVAWVRSLVEWFRFRPDGQTHAAARLRFLLQHLERNAVWKKNSAEVIRSVLRDSDATRLFSEVGLPSNETFGRELIQRMTRVFLPHFDDPTRMSHLLPVLFYESGDYETFKEIHSEQVDQIIAWVRTGLNDDEPLLPDFDAEMFQACQIILSRSMAISLREEVADRIPEISIQDQPLIEANRLLILLQEKWANNTIQVEDFTKMSLALDRTSLTLTSLKAHLEATGISVDLVYQMDRMKNDLIRLRRILLFLQTRRFEPAAASRIFMKLWWDLLRGLDYDRDASLVLRKHFGILARKIVERTGQSGEHYIAQTKVEYKAMFWGAVGGGMLTAFTALVKYFFDTHSWPLFLDFLYNSLNYSLSFLIMHFLHFKLATKQPSVTASHLAAQLKEGGMEADNDGFVDEVAKISRSQFAAVAGNILAVIPMALIVNEIYRNIVGKHFLSPELSVKVVMSLHPLVSGTLLFATFTGFILWLGSMIAGWCENASTFHRVPSIIRSHPFLRWWLGEKRTAALADSYMNNLAGVVSAVALGVMLAGPSTFSNFVGIPIEVRHVTLSTGGATYALQALDFDLHMVLISIWGILCIGALNFGISFLISLSIAIRAREIPRARVIQLFGQVQKRFWKKPGQFFLPQ